MRNPRRKSRRLLVTEDAEKPARRAEPPLAPAAGTH
jgi:hypothetical protein